MYYYVALQDELKKAIAEILSVDQAQITIEEPDSRIGADLAVPCFGLAKILKQNPTEIAQRIANALDIDDISSCSVTNGYLNINLKPQKLADGITKDIRDNIIFGTTNIGNGKSVVIDFIGLNLAKPFSVGHLRPTLQGWSLIQIYRAFGYTVIGDNHIGDWGTPFGMWVVGYLRWGNDQALASDGVYELGRLYVKFRSESKENPELIDEAKSWLKKLEAGDEEAIAFKNRFSKISLDHMYGVLNRLSIKSDENLGESFYIDRAQIFIKKLIDNGIAVEQDDGSVIADISEYGIDTPVLLRKADGSFLYATTDILAIDHRVNTWSPVKIVYSVGAEQKFHFEQIFALAKKIGYQVQLEHAWFGTIDEIDADGKRKKMSSRSGISYLEELLNLAEKKAREALPDGREVNDSDISTVANAAIKFTDFSQARRLNILFDWDSMFSLSGFSGPYVQYAAIRAQSILLKSSKKVDYTMTDLVSEDYDWRAEYKLLLYIAKYPVILKTVLDTDEPYHIAMYCFDLAKELNRYYEAVSVLNAEPKLKENRLWTIALVFHVLQHGLSMLGIAIPTRM